MKEEKEEAMQNIVLAVAIGCLVVAAVAWWRENHRPQDYRHRFTAVDTRGWITSHDGAGPHLVPSKNGPWVRSSSGQTPQEAREHSERVEAAIKEAEEKKQSALEWLHGDRS